MYGGFGGTIKWIDSYSVFVLFCIKYCHLVSKKFSNPQTIFFQPIKLLSLITYLPITFQFHIGHLWLGIANHLLSYLKRAENKNEVFFSFFWKKKPRKSWGSGIAICLVPLSKTIVLAVCKGNCFSKLLENLARELETIAFATERYLADISLVEMGAAGVPLRYSLRCISEGKQLLFDISFKFWLFRPIDPLDEWKELHFFKLL